MCHLKRKRRGSMPCFSTVVNIRKLLHYAWYLSALSARTVEQVRFVEAVICAIQALLIVLLVNSHISTCSSFISTLELYLSNLVYEILDQKTSNQVCQSILCLRNTDSGLKGETYCLPPHLLPTAHQISDIRQAGTLSSAQAKDFLTTCYLGLLDDTIDNLRRLSANPTSDSSSIPTKVSRLSYNLIMTSNWMMLVPRSAAKYYFHTGSEEDKDKLSLNSLAFAGSEFCPSNWH